MVAALFCCFLAIVVVLYRETSELYRSDKGMVSGLLDVLYIIVICPIARMVSSYS